MFISSRNLTKRRSDIQTFQIKSTGHLSSELFTDGKFMNLKEQINKPEIPCSSKYRVNLMMSKIFVISVNEAEGIQKIRSAKWPLTLTGEHL